MRSLSQPKGKKERKKERKKINKQNYANDTEL